MRKVEEGKKGFGTEVRLIAVTMPATSSGDVETLLSCEDVIEYAGRKCWASDGKFGTNPDRISAWIKVGHESVIEHSSATFYVVGSRVLTHELVRHRIASYSQRSQAFVDESEPRYITPPEFCESLLKGDGKLYNKYQNFMRSCWDLYRECLEAGMKKGIARYVLPNACETQIVMTMNFRELRHFIKLRTSKRAQPEIREVAEEVRLICKEIAPKVFEDL